MGWDEGSCLAWAGMRKELLSPFNFAAFYLPYVLREASRVLYLDTDAVVEADVTMLRRLDMGGAPAAAGLRGLISGGGLSKVRHAGPRRPHGPGGALPPHVQPEWWRERGFYKR